MWFVMGEERHLEFFCRAFRDQSYEFVESMSTRAFFDEIAGATCVFRCMPLLSYPSEPNGPFYYTWSSTLDEWGSAFFADVSPIEAVMILPANYDAARGHEHRQTVVW